MSRKTRIPSNDKYRSMLLSIFFAAFGTATRAELLPDGNFTSGQGAWAVINGAAVNFTLGDARVSARTDRSSGVGHNMMSILTPAMNGQSFTTRCTVTTTAPAPVRVFLKTTENGVGRTVVLAEEVVRDSNVAHTLRGVHTFDWAAFPTSAVIEVNIGSDTFDDLLLPGGGSFPNYTIDNVSIDNDTDADGLTNLEENAIGTSISNPDTDLDGLPDLWEYAHGTRPLLASAEDDDDGDTWSNRLEYWAATNPQDSVSKPAEPSNSHANAQARAVLRYLATLPANGASNHAVVGQHLTDPPNATLGFSSFITPLGDAPISRLPGVIAFQFDDGANPPDVAEPRQLILDQWNSGGLVEIKYNPRHPWTHGTYNNSDPSLVNISALLNPDPLSPSEMAAHDFFMQDLDVVAAELQYLRDQHVVVLWRFCSEMSGPHFWWGFRSQAEYIKLWRFFHDYFSDPNGWNLANLLWVYESHTPAHIARLPIDYYYPGDAYVDLMGHNFYHPTFRLEFDANAIMERYPKVYACPQVGPEKDPVLRDGTFSNMNYLVGTDGASGFINLHPRLSYFSIWDSFFNQYYHHIAIIDNPDAAEFMQHPYLVTRDELPSSLWLDASGVDGWMLE